jgi:hypothetical protein
MDVAYFLCAFLGTFGISLVWLVRARSADSLRPDLVVRISPRARRGALLSRRR